MKEFIDWTVFLGMHHSNEDVRISCKNFFIEKLKEGKKIYMSFESVGKCDDVVWGYERETQDKYYPFMDVLHSTAKILRLPYQQSYEAAIQKNKALSGLSFFDQMTVVIASEDILYTHNEKILTLTQNKIQKPVNGSEQSFPDDLEKLYQQSLLLKINW